MEFMRRLGFGSRKPREAQPVTLPLYANGKDLQTSETKDVFDPGKPDTLVGRIGQATEAQSKEVLDGAWKAWRSWAALSPEERAEKLIAALEGLDKTADERARLNTLENGKPLMESQIEMQVFVDRCRLAAELAPALNEVETFDPETEESVKGRQPYKFKTEVRREPMGLVTIIAPYNWPVAITAATLPYALIAGNCVTIKPPSSNPLALTTTIRHLAERLPAGVLNIVSGGHEVIEPLITDKRVQHVSFTGSTGGGQKIMELATENLARTTLELGGNDPVIFLEGAGLSDETISHLALTSFMTAGQVCMGIKRVYVHSSHYDELVEKLSAELDQWLVGHGTEDDVRMGPLIDEDQRDFVSRLVEEAREAGCEIRELGTLTDTAKTGGWFLKPTLVLNPPEDSGIVAKEQFGPALPIVKFDDEDALVDRLNEEWAGLCSSVWCADIGHATRVARRLRTGTTWINTHNANSLDDRAPFGGFRLSGVGREMGKEGLFEFTEAHTITRQA
ncbi:aldehyde dehydrogenase family protein [Parvularcula flava]|uniref:Aldehyde dehydrogenase n=1 Tax=Aquisalinus luteolus TaxID=1566827 RepID=A0A8J3ERX1_9PROT|nr:aldehyde dehydrogenase family protein [Aquisalinus luteolus]NHK29327.1 aldehyde dehydrogenase family protein [Aquisalinus luteolus]GGI01116.1 aldehyde dehydrogenase [Aquisalinus luteolus]